MNTPSKEALEAAKELFPDATSFYRFVAENAAEIIDRHFSPLRRRAEKAEARVKELKTLLASEKTTRNAIIAKGVATERANVELQKQEAESRRLFYTEQDKRQSAEYRSDVLAGALREARHLAASWESADGEPATELLKRIDAALALNAAGEPAKHPDTERLAFLIQNFAVLGTVAGRWRVSSGNMVLSEWHNTPEEALDAARKEVQP